MAATPETDEGDDGAGMGAGETETGAGKRKRKKNKKKKGKRWKGRRQNQRMFRRGMARGLRGGDVPSGWSTSGGRLCW